jgi:hypothetical protein
MLTRVVYWSRLRDAVVNRVPSDGLTNDGRTDLDVSIPRSGVVEDVRAAVPAGRREPPPSA